LKSHIPFFTLVFDEGRGIESLTIIASYNNFNYELSAVILHFFIGSFDEVQHTLLEERLPVNTTRQPI
jgi:hypothetical protein